MKNIVVGRFERSGYRILRRRYTGGGEGEELRATIGPGQRQAAAATGHGSECHTRARDGRCFPAHNLSGQHCAAAGLARVPPARSDRSPHHYRPVNHYPSTISCSYSGARAWADRYVWTDRISNSKSSTTAVTPCPRSCEYNINIFFFTSIKFHFHTSTYKRNIIFAQKPRPAHHRLTVYLHVDFLLFGARTQPLAQRRKISWCYRTWWAARAKFSPANGGWVTVEHRRTRRPGAYSHRRARNGQIIRSSTYSTKSKWNVSGSSSSPGTTRSVWRTTSGSGSTTGSWTRRRRIRTKFRSFIIIVRVTVSVTTEMAADNALNGNERVAYYTQSIGGSRTYAMTIARAGSGCMWLMTNERAGKKNVRSNFFFLPTVSLAALSFHKIFVFFLDNNILIFRSKLFYAPPTAPVHPSVTLRPSCRVGSK